jgi:hypothetical protein
MPEKQASFANEALFKLWSIVHDKGIINYFLEKDEKLDKVLNIFIRINSGGTILSYSDILLSIATAQWEQWNAREVIIPFVDELNNIGDGFSFNKDFVLKSCLVLGDLADIAFKVDNFNKATMSRIEKEWDQVEQALRAAVTLVSGFGFSRDTLTANYVIIPIAYYLKKIGLPRNFDVAGKYSEDRELIRRWLILSLIKRVFGGVPDSVLRPLREVLRMPSSGFPLGGIIDQFKGSTKPLVPTADDIETMLCYKYGQGYTFSTLALLYPTLDFRNKFHIDHLHPQSLFTRSKLRKKGIPEADIDFYMENADQIPNLQLLEGVPNQEKGYTDFKDWIEDKHRSEKEKAEYMGRHFIPGVDLSLENFREFIEARRAKMREEFRRIIGL